jgi:hypothetical protein
MLPGRFSTPEAVATFLLAEVQDDFLVRAYIRGRIQGRESGRDDRSYPGAGGGRREMSVFIELDRRRELRFTLESITKMAKMLAILGINWTKLLESNLSGYDKMKYLFWAGLVHEQSELTLDDVGDLLTINVFKLDDPVRHQKELAAAINTAMDEFHQEVMKNQTQKKFAPFIWKRSNDNN